MLNLKSFFNPKTVAIVGVSDNPKKVGYLVAKNMLDQKFKGELYFVNISEKKILGKKTFKDLKSIKKKFDLVILCIPASQSVCYLENISENGCQNVVIFSAGFAETGTQDGLLLNEKLLKFIKEHGINVLGPNCIGFINTKASINATFFQSTAPFGNVGIISQSGALGTAFLDYVQAKTNLGISYLISLGNKLNISESDCLEFLSKDKDTKVIGMYLEDIKDGARFARALKEAAKLKPVVILKSGRTKEGSQAALSHTGSMSSDDQIFDTVISLSGAVRACDYAEFEMLLKLYSLGAVPFNNKVLVLSNAGGMGVLLADELILSGLKLVTVNKDVALKLNKAFESIKKITVHNPIDLLGDASAFDYQKAIDLSMQEKDIGAVIVLLTPQANTEILDTAKVLEGIYNKFKFKPLFPIFMGKESVKEAHDFFEKHKMASFRYSSELPVSLAKIIKAEEIRKNNHDFITDFENEILFKARANVARALLENTVNTKRYLNQYDSLSVISNAGIKVASPYLVSKIKELDLIVEKEGFPLVCKIATSKITHKTEFQGVFTGITVKEELYNAFNFLNLKQKVFGNTSVYVQKQCSGHELIIGGKRDPVFGVVIIVGLGGVYAELLQEVVTLTYPFSFAQFEDRIKTSKINSLLYNFRNMTPINLQDLYNVCYKLGTIFKYLSIVKEIDINPIIATPDGLVAVDARIII